IFGRKWHIMGEVQGRAQHILLQHNFFGGLEGGDKIFMNNFEWFTATPRDYICWSVFHIEIIGQTFRQHDKIAVAFWQGHMPTVHQIGVKTGLMIYARKHVCARGGGGGGGGD
ncbi:hypothetical protein ACJX0J_010221, partial [Zea mays]